MVSILRYCMHGWRAGDYQNGIETCGPIVFTKRSTCPFLYKLTAIVVLPVSVLQSSDIDANWVI